MFRLECRRDGGPCQPAWSSEGTGSAAAPAIGGDVIYVHAHGELQAFPRTCPGSRCRLLWAETVPESNGLSVIVAGDVLLVDGIGYRRNGTRLLRVWQSSVIEGSRPISPVLVHGGTVYIGSDRVSASRLRCGGLATACPPTWSSPERFEADIGQTLTWSEPVAAGGLIFSSAGVPAAFIEGCGVRGEVCEPVWTGRAAFGTSRPAVSSSALVVTTSGGGIVAYAPSAA